MTAPSDLCICGHDAATHEHWRRDQSTSCGLCSCPRYAEMPRPVWRPSLSMLITAAVILSGLALAGWWGQSVALGAGPIRAHGGRTPCPTIATCRRVVRWQAKDRAHLRRQVRLHYADQVELGYELGQAFFGVDLHALGYCESTNDPLSVSGQYAGITNQGPGFYDRPENARIYRYIRQVPAKPYARPVFVAIANIMVAARWISLHGSSEWQCRLDGSVKHGGPYS